MAGKVKTKAKPVSRAKTRGVAGRAPLLVLAGLPQASAAAAANTINNDGRTPWRATTVAFPDRDPVYDVAAVEELANAIGNLKGLKNMQPALIAVHRLEDEGDRVVRDAIAELFHEGDIDPIIVIRWKDIFEALEDALDSCETAANVIGNIFVKNA